MEEETLEQEFNRYKKYHKYNIITATILIEGRKKLSKIVPALDEYAELKGDKEDIAFAIADDLEEKAKKDSTEYDIIYETCWRQIRNKISDKKSYHLES